MYRFSLFVLAATAFIGIGRVCGAQASKGVDYSRLQAYRTLQHPRSLEPEVPGSYANVEALAFSPDGKLLASGAMDVHNVVRLWEVATGKMVAAFPVETTPEGSIVYEVLFSPNGKTLAVVSQSGGRIPADTILLWNVRTRQLQRRWTGQPGTALWLGFTRDGRALASEAPSISSGSAAKPEGWVNVWDVQAQKRLQQIKTADPFPPVAFSPDGSLLAILSAPPLKLPLHEVKEAVELWMIAQGNRLVTLPMQGDIAPVIVFASDGKRLACRSTIFGSARPGEPASPLRSEVQLWDIATGKPVQTLIAAHTTEFSAACFCPNGRAFVTGGQDGTVILWDVQTAAQSRVLTQHRQRVTSLTFSADGHLLASGSEDGKIQLWRMP
ncbi:MAG TPA: WD40 repeat domain-containing protein [Chthonomonadaceae bacterium]|nr:WD40 repeat domain-containing protein [Chthonomonadaceae bacterium]